MIDVNTLIKTATYYSKSCNTLPRTLEFPCGEFSVVLPQYLQEIKNDLNISVCAECCDEAHRNKDPVSMASFSGIGSSLIITLYVPEYSNMIHEFAHAIDYTNGGLTFKRGFSIDLIDEYVANCVVAIISLLVGYSDGVVDSVARMRLVKSRFKIRTWVLYHACAWDRVRAIVNVFIKYMNRDPHLMSIMWYWNYESLKGCGR